MQSADSPRQIAQTLPQGAKKILAADRRFLFASGKNVAIMILYKNLGFGVRTQDAEIFKKRGSYDMIPHGKEIKVFTGSSNPDLADMICKNLGISLGKSTVTAFATASAPSPSTSPSAAWTCSSCRAPASRSMTAHGAAGHDRRNEACLRRPHHRRHPVFRLCPAGPQGQGPRPISAKLVANLLTVAGADRVLTWTARRADPGLL